MDEERERPQNYSEAEYGAQQKEIREKVHIEEYATLSEAKKREWFLKCTPQGGKEKKKILGNAGIPARRA